MDVVERCASCGGIITANDESFLWCELVVCRACYGTLATNEREPALTRPMQFGPLTIGPDVLTYGSVTVPIQSIASVQTISGSESSEEQGVVAWYIICGVCGPLLILFIGGPVVGWISRFVPESAGFAAAALLFIFAGGVFVYCGLKILDQLTGKRSAMFLLVTTSAGQEVRIDFANANVMNHALAAIRRATAARIGTSNTLNVAVLNSADAIRRR
jgi:hypothetical protein